MGSVPLGVRVLHLRIERETRRGRVIRLIGICLSVGSVSLLRAVLAASTSSRPDKGGSE